MSRTGCILPSLTGREKLEQPAGVNSSSLLRLFAVNDDVKERNHGRYVMKFAYTALLFTAAAQGCIGLDLSRDTVAPTPAKWEYLTHRPEAPTITLTSTGESQAQSDPELTRLGSEGWELVAVHAGNYILKRAKTK